MHAKYGPNAAVQAREAGDQLLGDAGIRRVDVAHASGVEAHVDLAQRLVGDAVVVGDVLSEVPDRLAVPELVDARDRRAERGDDIAEAMPEVRLDAGMALLVGQHLLALVHRANVGDRHRVDPPVPEVVGAMPHQLHWCAAPVRDVCGLDRSVGEEVPTE